MPKAKGEYTGAMEVAEIAVEVFCKMHPHIRMNIAEWMDLEECIRLEIVANDAGDPQLGAHIKLRE